MTSAAAQRRVIAERICQHFGASHPLFSDVSFTLVPNEVYALTGPSGSGKSTLLGLLAGWSQPTSGRLVRENIRSTAWVFQNPHGVAARSVEDHVALPLLARGLDRAAARASARETLALVGLEALSKTPFATLSGGEAQRLMLARGLSRSPDLLLVDEPTAQLDPHTAKSVNEAIAGIAGRGAIVVVATHDDRTRDACTAVVELGRR